MPQSTDRLLLQFLDYLARAPRTYADVMDAWRSSCPRLTVWEDALAAGAIEIASDKLTLHCQITLTPRGRALLDAAAS